MDIKKRAERNAKIKRTIAEIERTIAKLERTKDEYIARAVSAKQNGEPQSYGIAKRALNITLSQIKRAKEMLLNIQITAELQQMAELNSDFLSTMSAMAKSISKVNSQSNFVKLQKDINSALSGAEEARDGLETFLDRANTALSTLEQSQEELPDAEIDRLISGGLSEKELLMDAEIERMTEALRERGAAVPAQPKQPPTSPQSPPAQPFVPKDPAAPTSPQTPPAQPFVPKDPAAPSSPQSPPAQPFVPKDPAAPSAQNIPPAPSAQNIPPAPSVPDGPPPPPMPSASGVAPVFPQPNGSVDLSSRPSRPISADVASARLPIAAGATEPIADASGKALPRRMSVYGDAKSRRNCLVGLIAAQLASLSAEKVRIAVADLSEIGLNVFNGAAHMSCNAAESVEGLFMLLDALAAEYARRQKVLSEWGAGDIYAYLARGGKMPFIVAVFDGYGKVYADAFGQKLNAADGKTDVGIRFVLSETARDGKYAPTATDAGATGARIDMNAVAALVKALDGGVI